MKPTASQVHRDAALSNLSISYQGQEFIADKVFPTVLVDKDSDEFPTWSLADLMRDDLEKRAPGTAASLGDQTLSWDSYSLVEFARGSKIPDEVIQNEDAVVQTRQAVTISLKEKAMLRRDRAFAADFFKSGTWDSDAAVAAADRWNDSGASDPLSDIDERIESMRQACGKKPTAGILGAGVWSVLKRHPAVLMGIKYTGRAVATLADLASLTGVPTWYVGGTIYTSSAEGAATATFADVWGKSMLLLHVTPNPGRFTATAGVTFTRRNTNDVIETWRDEEVLADILRIRTKFDQKAVATPLGRFLGTCID